MITVLDINADVGEGVNNESKLLPLLSSCNIACGGHAGDVETINSVLDLAKMHQVKVGAHPGFPDREGFGRRVIALSRKRLKETLTQQIQQVKKLAELKGIRLHHVKPHGALYNLAAKDESTSKTIIETIQSIDDNLMLYVPYQSVIEMLAKNKLRTAIEGFADRAYNEDYSLVSRTREGAVLHNIEDVEKHLKGLFSGKLCTINGTELPFKLETLCVHGDTPEALEIVKKIRELTTKLNIKVS